jgi:hypothetical protein
MSLMTGVLAMNVGPKDASRHQTLQADFTQAVEQQVQAQSDTLMKHRNLSPTHPTASIKVNLTQVNAQVTHKLAVTKARDEHEREGQKSFGLAAMAFALLGVGRLGQASGYTIKLMRQNYARARHPRPRFK